MGFVKSKILIKRSFFFVLSELHGEPIGNDENKAFYAEFGWFMTLQMCYWGAKRRIVLRNSLYDARVLGLIPLFWLHFSLRLLRLLSGVFQAHVRHCQRRQKFKVRNHRWRLTLTSLRFTSTWFLCRFLFLNILKETVGGLLHLAVASLFFPLKWHVTPQRGVFCTAL